MEATITATLTKQTITSDLEWGHATHIGRRSSNQDALYVSKHCRTSGRGKLFAVADGMGGQQGGGLAGRIAVRGLAAYHHLPISGLPPWDAPHLKRHLEETVFRIDRQVRKYGLDHPALADLGTTLSCLVVTAQHTIIAHVGDSRIYRLRCGHLTRLTVDHTFVQEMIFEGEVDAARADTHPLRHLLTSAVGTAEPLEWVDTRIDPLYDNDIYLLCSDGLHSSLSSEQINHFLSEGGHARTIALNLISQALEMGATDNVTALVIKNGNDGS